MNTYTYIYSGGDMTTEACTTKLAYLFGRLANNPTLVSQMLTQDIRGECSDVSRVGKKFFNHSENHIDPSGLRNVLMRL
jgi:hypothetical protein